MLRTPAVAGQFYPSQAERLRDFLEDAVPPSQDPFTAVGVVSPHAGYVYSGKIAGAVFSKIDVPDTALLLGPNHTGLGTAASVMSRGAWATPLGPVAIDEDLADAVKASCPIVEEDSLAHAQEHSLEVQLPFLRHCNPRVRFVPIAFMLQGYDEIQEVGLALADVLRDWPGRVLIVASSDMTHYEPHDMAKEKDAKAIEKVLALDARGLLDTTKRHGISMCGVIPTAVLLCAARKLGATTYATSGEVSGDYSSVVGYAGMVIS
jgi:AmmeMemoRadiSam system protein B